MHVTLNIGTAVIDLTESFWILIGYLAIAITVFPIATLVVLFRSSGPGGYWARVKAGAFLGIVWPVLLIVICSTALDSFKSWRARRRWFFPR